MPVREVVGGLKRSWEEASETSLDVQQVSQSQQPQDDDSGTSSDSSEDTNGLRPRQASLLIQKPSSNQATNNRGAYRPELQAGAKRLRPNAHVDQWRLKAEEIKHKQLTGLAEGLAHQSRWKYAMVCSSNINRSVMGQKALNEAGMAALSFGIGRDVRLPGPSQDKPKVFQFGTPYLEMYDSCYNDDPHLYEANSVLSLLRRDSQIKLAPQRWQDMSSLFLRRFDVIICFEDRITDIVVRDMLDRDIDPEGVEDQKILHIISIPVRDSASDSERASTGLLALCTMLEAAELDTDIAGIVEEFQETNPNQVRSHQTVLF